MVKKISIVYLLIMVQGFILAHSFVPHHHHDADLTATHSHADGHVHQHQHHSDSHEQDDHSSATSIFDILFSNIHHSGDNVVYVQRNDITVQKTVKKANSLAILTFQQEVSIPYLILRPILYETTTITHYSNKYNLNFSLRGPPFFIV